MIFHEEKHIFFVYKDSIFISSIFLNWKVCHFSGRIGWGRLLCWLTSGGVMIVADLNSQQLVAQLWGIQAAGIQLIMIVIDVLVCMEMVIDGGMVMVIDDDIHDDCHVIVIAI